jgi:diguanylate cyclase (GGDEF)-like protein
MLAERWRLPVELVAPIRFHEQPTAAPAGHAGLVRCVGLGNVAHDVLTDRAPGPALARFHTRAAEWFEIDASVADDLIHRIAEGARQLSPLFQVNTGPYPDAEAVMARAREQIIAISSAPARAGHDPLRTLIADSDQHDALTGMLDPRALTLRAETAFHQSIRDKKPLSVVSIGIDGFDRLVAAGGDGAGDAALVELAALIESQFDRHGGQIGRDGRCTFCIVLPGVARPDAVRTTATFRSSLLSVSPGWSLPGLEPRPLAVSVGIAAAEPGTEFPSAASLLDSASRAREAAYAAGGDGVRTFSPRLAA